MMAVRLPAKSCFMPGSEAEMSMCSPGSVSMLNTHPPGQPGSLSLRCGCDALGCTVDVHHPLPPCVPSTSLYGQMMMALALRTMVVRVDVSFCDRMGHVLRESVGGRPAAAA